MVPDDPHSFGGSLAEGLRSMSTHRRGKVEKAMVRQRVYGLIAAIFFISFGHFPAYAYFNTGTDLLGACSKDDFNIFKCYGYISGVIDNLQLLQQANLIRGANCIPGDATLGQLKDVVVKYAVQNPEERHQNASYLVMRAIVQAFPCPNSPAPPPAAPPPPPPRTNSKNPFQN
jgi:hypothetical protein